MIDLRATVAVCVRMQDRRFDAQRLGGLEQQARAPGKGFLEVPVLLILIDRGTRHRLGRIGEQRDSRQAVVGAHEQAVGVDESRLIAVLRRRPKRKHVAERHVEEAPDGVRSPVRVSELATARFDQTRPPPELGRVRDESQGAGQRAGAIQGSLRSTQNLHLFQIVQLKVTVDGGIAHIRAHRGLLECAETARRLAGRIDAADDRDRGPGQARAVFVHAEAGDLSGKRSEVGHPGLREPIRAHDRHAVGHRFQRLLAAGRRDGHFLERGHRGLLSGGRLLRVRRGPHPVQRHAHRGPHRRDRLEGSLQGSWLGSTPIEAVRHC